MQYPDCRSLPVIAPGFFTPKDKGQSGSMLLKTKCTACIKPLFDHCLSSALKNIQKGSTKISPSITHACPSYGRNGKSLEEDNKTG